MLGTRGTSKIRVIVSDDDDLRYHSTENSTSYPPYKQQVRVVGRSVTWRGVLSISCMDGCVHAYVHAGMGFGTVYPSVNDASAFLGRAQKRQIAWRRQREERRRGGGAEEEVMVMGKEFDDRACEMTAEYNGYLGQLPTLSGLQVADPGMADGWTDMK